MKTVTSGKTEDHTVYSVSLPLIFFTYILLTGVQVILDIPILGNPIALLVNYVFRYIFNEIFM
jgi:hypothetical protein